MIPYLAVESMEQMEFHFPKRMSEFGASLYERIDAPATVVSHRSIDVL
jgi:hypothetical protein